MDKTPTIRLHVPDPPARPGETPNFDYLTLAGPGETRMPALDETAEAMRDMPWGLVRLMDGMGNAIGPWADWLGTVDPDLLRKGLRDMMTTRTIDRRMQMAQRQGKTTNHAQCTGEEAIACGFQSVLEQGDMNFPTYRQQGLLFAAGYPIHMYMNQVFGNSGDPVLGRQLAVMTSAKDHGFFTISGNLATQFVQAVGWAMGSAISEDSRIAAGWIGDGAAAEGDFHWALLFASVYKPPVVLNLVNNQWAISTFSGLTGGGSQPFATRGIGYGLPAIRVDGNDFLAVLAASKWVTDRARQGHGPTLVEWLTYRAASHTTSDDPTVYRAKNESAAWPLGDPIERLKQHLVAMGEWSDERHAQAQAEIDEHVKAEQKIAESFGTMLDGGTAPAGAMFTDVYKDMPENLRRQRQKAGI